MEKVATPANPTRFEPRSRSWSLVAERGVWLVATIAFIAGAFFFAGVQSDLITRYLPDSKVFEYSYLLGAGAMLLHSLIPLVQSLASDDGVSPFAVFLYRDEIAMADEIAAQVLEQWQLEAANAES